jgi:hypothetical protein
MIEKQLAALTLTALDDQSAPQAPDKVFLPAQVPEVEPESQSPVRIPRPQPVHNESELPNVRATNAFDNSAACG